MAIEKYIIDKLDVTTLLRGEDLAIQPKGNIKGFCVEIAGNLTNGDMIKAMFPNIDVSVSGDGDIIDVYNLGVYCETFDTDWWNAPYKADKGKTMTREEAIKQLNKLKSFHNGSYGEAVNFAIESIKVDMAYDLAYEDAESDREKGHWVEDIINGKAWYSCSECWHMFSNYERCYHYCPCCGKELKGVVKNDM